MTRDRAITGIGSVGMGTLLILLVHGVIPGGSVDPRVPDALGTLGGMVFIAAGALLLVGRATAMTHVAAFVFFASFTAILGWIAWRGPDELFSGNPDGGRLVFGAAAVMAGAITVFGTLSVFFRRPRDRSDTVADPRSSASEQ